MVGLEWQAALPQLEQITQPLPPAKVQPRREFRSGDRREPSLGNTADNDRLAGPQVIDRPTALSKQILYWLFRTAAGWGATVFAHESPTRSVGFDARRGLYSFALTVPSVAIFDVLARGGVSVTCVVDLFQFLLRLSNSVSKRETVFADLHNDDNSRPLQQF
jgi:hypothetical protein